jgi:hypothetical protein
VPYAIDIVALGHFYSGKEDKHIENLKINVIFSVYNPKSLSFKKWRFNCSDPYNFYTFITINI